MSVLPDPRREQSLSLDGSGASPATHELLEVEVRGILDECSRQAHDVLTANRRQLEMLVAELLEKETLHADDLYRATGLPAPDAPAIP